MPDFNVRSDSVNVEQIMRQIRARIREKRGVDYTEQQIRELAAVKLERFLDPSKVRSELLQQFREGGIGPLPNYSFEDTTLFESRRPWLAFIRRKLKPLLQLFINPDRLIQALHMQADINAHHEQYTNLAYEVLHNLVVEVTRQGLEVKNLKMRVESLSGRLEFGERRVRALEGVVEYRPGAIAEEEPAAAAQPAGREAGEGADQQGASEARRRRRRRRGRRGGAGRPGNGDETSTETADAIDAAGSGAPETPGTAEPGGAGAAGHAASGGGEQGAATEGPTTEAAPARGSTPDGESQ